MPWAQPQPRLDCRSLVGAECRPTSYFVCLKFNDFKIETFLNSLIYRFVLSLTDKPGPPGGPIEFKTVTAEKITLLWQPPADDGGAKITHYIVEKRETSRVVWSMVSEDLEECIIKTTKIIKGNEYIFRVRAVNKYGIGDALESHPVIARNAFGEIQFH